MLSLNHPSSAVQAVGTMAPPEFEILRVIHVGRDGLTLGVTEQTSGRADRVEVTLRELAADALRLGSSTLILAHNHPRGDPTPSRADIIATRRIGQLAGFLGIRLHDHVVTAGARSFSFREAGLL